MDGESARLLSDYLRGDDGAATEIFNKYLNRLIALAQSKLSQQLQAHVDAEDVVQSAYRSFFRKARDQEIVLQRSGDLWRVLAAFTINKTRNHVARVQTQKRDFRLEQNDPSWLELAEDGPTPEHTTIAVEQLASFMITLRPRDRRIIELRLRGESIDEIVSDLADPGPESDVPPEQVSTATVRRVLRNSKEKLEQMLFES